MKLTLKVAEVASILYALLCFGSYCINAVYYSVFGVDISAYMSISEILLLFLAQPILYIPIILSGIVYLFIPYHNDQTLSIRRLYVRLAWRDDLIVLVITICLLFLVKVWYDIRLDSVIYLTIVLAFICASIIPSLMNAFILMSFGMGQEIGDIIIDYFKSEKYKEDFEKVVKKIKDIPRLIKTIPARLKNKKETIEVEENRGEGSRLVVRLGLRSGVYRTCILHHRFSKSETKRLRWIHNNFYVYFFLLVYSFSIIVMSAANYSLALELKKGAIAPQKTISYVYSDSTKEVRNDDILIGESTGYLFFFNEISQLTSVIRKERIDIIGIQVNYPSISIMRRRINKGIKEIKKVDSERKIREFLFPNDSTTKR